MKLNRNKYSHFGRVHLWSRKYVQAALQKNAEEISPVAQILIILYVLFEYLGVLYYTTASIIPYKIHWKRREYGNEGHLVSFQLRLMLLIFSLQRKRP